MGWAGGARAIWGPVLSICSTHVMIYQAYSVHRESWGFLVYISLTWICWCSRYMVRYSWLCTSALMETRQFVCSSGYEMRLAILPHMCFASRMDYMAMNPTLANDSF